MRAVSVSANEWIYPDIQEYESQSDHIELHAPRNSYACVQIVVFGTKPGAKIEITCAGESTLRQPEIFRLLDVRVEENNEPTDDDHIGYHTVTNGHDVSDYATRPAPFRVFDIMQPLGDNGEIVENDTTALYLAWRIPNDIDLGNYKGQTTITVGNRSFVFPTIVIVHTAAIPEEGRLAISNSYNFENIAEKHHVKIFSETYFELVRQYMLLMRRTRQTHMPVSLSTVMIKDNGNGQYDYDFSMTERIIRMALDAGFSIIEFGCLLGKSYATDDVSYYVFYTPNGRKILYNSQEAYLFMADFLPSFVKFLKDRCWYDISIQHLGDEPSERKEGEYRLMSGIVRKFMPGMKMTDAICTTGLAGAVDIMAPLNYMYEKKKEEFDAIRKAGDELWFYTCCSPTGKYLNRFLDMELLRTRLLHWGNYRYNLKGYSHWGFNSFQGDTEYLREHSCGMSDNGITFWPPGDTHLSYPGNGNGPWLSVRLERMRAGVEDYELLCILAEKSPEDADRICRTVMRRFYDYTTDVLEFERAFRELLSAVDTI